MNERDVITSVWSQSNQISSPREIELIALTAKAKSQKTRHASRGERKQRATRTARYKELGKRIDDIERNAR